MDEIIDFNRFFGDYLKDCMKELTPDMSEYSIEMLEEMLNSGEAIEFTERMNKKYRENNVRDENGDTITIERPINISNKIIWDNDRKTAKLMLSAAEDRWFRSDALYGKNMLKNLGFKYTI